MNKQEKDLKIKSVFQIFSKKGFDVSTLYANKTQQENCVVLFDAKGLVQIGKALDAYKMLKDLPFCPQCMTPYDLAKNWPKLLEFNKKYK